jgi:hypothetical protein
MLTVAAIGDLKGQLTGALLVPTDGEYDAARRVWNGMIGKRPAVRALLRTAHAEPHGANPHVQASFTRAVRQVPRPIRSNGSCAGESKQEQAWTQLTLIGAPWSWWTTRRS